MIEKEEYDLLISDLIDFLRQTDDTVSFVHVYNKVAEFGEKIYFNIPEEVNFLLRYKTPFEIIQMASMGKFAPSRYDDEDEWFSIQYGWLESNNDPRKLLFNPETSLREMANYCLANKLAMNEKMKVVFLKHDVNVKEMRDTDESGTD